MVRRAARAVNPHAKSQIKSPDSRDRRASPWAVWSVLHKTIPVLWIQNVLIILLRIKTGLTQRSGRITTFDGGVNSCTKLYLSVLARAVFRQKKIGEPGEKWAVGKSSICEPPVPLPPSLRVQHQHTSKKRLRHLEAG